jgi:glycine betaine/choline ABC-type transport system substrate-binding protein
MSLPSKSRRHAVALSLALVLSALALACVVVGCGSADTREDGKRTITVTSRGYTEEKLLREIYAHALEAAGFDVKRTDDPALLPPEELEQGIVSGYPDHLETALTEVGQLGLDDVPGSTEAAYREAKDRLGEYGLVPFPPTSFARSSAVAIRRTTAERLGVRTLTDLSGPAPRMSVVEGEYFCYCHGRQCLSGLERDYRIAFDAFSTVEPQQRLYRKLRAGDTDAAVVLSSEGWLAREKPWLVVLEDEDHRLPASNAIWMTSRQVIDEAGPDYEKAILAAQRGLTLQVIRRLNAEIELGGKQPGEVAADYLDSIGYAS